MVNLEEELDKFEALLFFVSIKQLVEQIIFFMERLCRCPIFIIPRMTKLLMI